MSAGARRTLIILALSLVGVAALLTAAGTFLLRGSLPRLNGSTQISGLEEPVLIERDNLGVPTIHAANRVDAARALGFLHGQDRFFQMDLLRRSAAGELAALFGPAALDADRDTRRHRFRHRAAKVIAAASPFERALITAYTAGVNDGLADLRVRPFEYLLLRQAPQPWFPDDTVLVVCAMFLDLSLFAAHAEGAEATVRDTLPPALASLLLPESNRWEAPLQDGGAEFPHMPTDLDLHSGPGSTGPDTGRYIDSLETEPTTRDAAGSNNWAVAGRLSGHGGALLANDMHLGLSLPNTWYRVRTIWRDQGRSHETIGVTLPGVPALVTGSNGQVAWGFTNSYGDWSDLVILETDSLGRYRTPDGWQELARIEEQIDVAGAESETLIIEESRWGPVWSTDLRGRPLVLRWTAHDTEALNLSWFGLESVSSVDEAVLLAATVGMPPQNMVCADSTGSIAWTIAGRIPRRVGWDGRLPVSWADGSHAWRGYLDAQEQPRILDPDEGRLWTANNRVTAGNDLARIGQGGYALGARARQIRDGLRAMDRPLEADMLALQLDDRALFLEEWRQIAHRALAGNESSSADRSEFQRLTTDGWDGRASTTSVAYRLVRAFRIELVSAIYDHLTADCSAADPQFNARWLLYTAAVAFELVDQRPANLLPPGQENWDSVILAAIDRAMETATAEGRPAAEFTWGERNTTRIAHPFTLFTPQLARWLAAPQRAMPGGSFMPRVQHPSSGASERMVVSPGREAEGIFHMPG
ncbi:penicillin acylase family protein, partial [bacterium]